MRFSPKFLTRSRVGSLFGDELACSAGYTNPNVFPQRGRPMAELYCPCPERHKLWGEFWWVEGQYQWVFFDDLQTSETCAEQVEHCPACGRRLERNNLRTAVNPTS